MKCLIYSNYSNTSQPSFLLQSAGKDTDPLALTCKKSKRIRKIKVLVIQEPTAKNPTILYTTRKLELEKKRMDDIWRELMQTEKCRSVFKYMDEE